MSSPDAAPGRGEMHQAAIDLVESIKTHCPRCKVPWGEYGCEHEPLTSRKLLRALGLRIRKDGRVGVKRWWHRGL